MPDYAIDIDVLNRLQPKIRQWEITHGGPMPADQYRALVEGALGVATKEARAEAVQSEAISLDRERLNREKDRAEKADRAAAIGGAVDIATAGGTGYLAYKQLGVMEKQAASYDKLVESLAAKKTAATPAIELTKGAGGVFAAPTAPATVAPAAPMAVDVWGTGPGVQGILSPGGAAVDVGGQAALASPGAALAADTSIATSAADASMMAETGAGAEAAGAGAGGVMLAVAAGYATGHVLSKVLGANEDISQGMELGGAGLAAGFMIGGPVGAAVGLLAGVGVSLFDDSVVCSELLRQGRITPHARVRCVVFRKTYIADDVFAGYLLWAGPHVKAMQRGGWRNSIRLPFAHAFVRYMVKLTSPWRTKPTWFERIVYNYVFKRCRNMAARAEKEVRHAAMA